MPYCNNCHTSFNEDYCFNCSKKGEVNHFTIIKIYICTLTGSDGFTNTEVTLNPLDLINIGGYDSNKEWQMFTGQARMLSRWAKENGMKGHIVYKEIDITEDLKQKSYL